ncbi:MAG: hypothetical protein N4A46_00365 [Schleiferiaceae bacterium]|jgi:hypothetical protein|nr:hypothetical protein [Schleiferiaceae bacterium]
MINPIQNCVSNLQSSNSELQQEALDFIADLNYFDQPIKEEDYLVLVQTLVDLAIRTESNTFQSDVLTSLEQLLYSNSPESTVSKEVFREALMIITKSTSSIFIELLTPLQSSMELKEELKDYFDLQS